MRATHHYHTPHVRAVHTGHDLVQMVSSHDHVLLDLTGTHYDVTGWPRAEHASIDLPIAAARAVAAALLEAIDEAVTTEPPGQTALWSESALRAMASEAGDRRRAA